MHLIRWKYRAQLFNQDVRIYNHIKLALNLFGIINYMQQSAERPTYNEANCFYSWFEGHR